MPLPFDKNSRDEEAIAREYVRLVRSCARPYFLAGGDYEDLVQEGMIGLLKAIREFDATKSDNFEAFAFLCVRRKIYDAVRKSHRNDGRLSIEFSEIIDDTSMQGNTNHSNPEALLLAKEAALEIKMALSGILSSFETSVLRFYFQGYTSSQIAQKLSRDSKSVDNAIGRIRRKLATHLSLERKQE